MSNHCPHCAYQVAFETLTHCILCGYVLEGSQEFACYGRQDHLQTLSQYLKEVQAHQSFQKIALYGVKGIGISWILQAFKVKHTENFDPVDFIYFHPFAHELYTQQNTHFIHPCSTDEQQQVLSMCQCLLHSIFNIDLTQSLEEQTKKFKRLCYLWSIPKSLMLELTVILGYQTLERGSEPLVSTRISHSIQPASHPSMTPDEMISTLHQHNLPGYTQKPAQQTMIEPEVIVNHSPLPSQFDDTHNVLYVLDEVLDESLDHLSDASLSQEDFQFNFDELSDEDSDQPQQESPDLLSAEDTSYFYADSQKVAVDLASSHDSPKFSPHQVIDSIAPVALLSSGDIVSLLATLSPDPQVLDSDSTHKVSTHIETLSHEDYISYAISKVAELIQLRSQDRVQLLLLFDLDDASDQIHDSIEKLLESFKDSAILCIAERPQFTFDEQITVSSFILENISELLRVHLPKLPQPISYAQTLMQQSQGIPLLVMEQIYFLQNNLSLDQTVDLSTHESQSSLTNQYDYTFEDFLMMAAIIGPTFTLLHVKMVIKCLQNHMWNRDFDDTLWNEYLQQAQVMNMVASTNHPRFVNEISYRFQRYEDQKYYAYQWEQRIELSQRQYVHQCLAESLKQTKQPEDAWIQNALTISDHYMQLNMSDQAAEQQFKAAQYLIQRGSLKWAYATLQQVIELLKPNNFWSLWSQTYELYAKIALQIGETQNAEQAYHLLLQRAYHLNDTPTIYKAAQALRKIYEQHNFQSQVQQLTQQISQLSNHLADDLDLVMKTSHHETSIDMSEVFEQTSEFITPYIPLKGQWNMKHHIEGLSPPPPTIIKVLTHLQHEGYEAWVVGGSVRDRLLDRDVHDWDLTTSATPEEVMSCFKKVIPTGIQHGTVTVIIDQLHVEITTYRIDGNYEDGRRPDDIQFTRSLEEDLARRDLTINAIAWDPVTQQLTDPFEGQKDLEANILRAVGSADDRFKEDGLRPLRAIRFAATLGFEIESNTQEAIRNALPSFRKVAMERVQVEFFKALCGEHVVWGLHMLKNFGYLEEFMPEINQLNVEQWQTTLEALKHTSPFLLTRLALLFHICDDPIYTSKTILKRLNCANRLIQEVQHLLQLRDIDASTPRTNAQMRALTAQIQLRHLESYWQYRLAWAHGTQAQDQIKMWQNLWEALESLQVDQSPQTSRDLALSGHQVCQLLQINPSKQVGQVLHSLLQYVWENPEANTVEALSKQVVVVANHLGISHS